MVDIKAEGANPIDKEAVLCILQDIGVLMNSMRKMCISSDGEEAAVIQVMAEKTGWLADRGIAMLDGAAVCGDFANWADYRQAPELETQQG